MPSQTPRPYAIWTPFIFFLVLIAGIVIGYQVNRYMVGKRPITAVVERNDRLEELISIIQAKYVDSLNSDSLYNDAVAGILKHLDPHTVYIPASQLAEINSGLGGNFTGIGLQYQLLRDTIIVTKVIRNGPADVAGILPGDKIISSDQTRIAGKISNTDEIARLFRGVDGSKIALGILRRPEAQQLKYINVVRGNVPLYSIDAAYILETTTGYIRINRFSATTYREFLQALEALLDQGMTQLILDLRQNPGGYLEAATAIADELINGDKLLLYTKGRTAGQSDFKAERKGKFEQGRLAVLVDEGSASASEIIAGAIQDWDRGVVVGRRTYGKGLVQEQYELEDGAALRLTVARYYTPSGRSIQRPYDKGREAYALAYQKRIAAGPVTDSTDTLDPGERYYTVKRHRLVYGGGGIRPDIVVPLTYYTYATAWNSLFNSSLVPNLIYDYFDQHAASLNKLNNYDQLEQYGHTHLDTFMQQLKAEVAVQYPAVSRELWNHPEAEQHMQRYVMASLASLLFGEMGYYRQINQDDAVMQRAQAVLHSAEYDLLLEGGQLP